jgi:hypothetical protein
MQDDNVGGWMWVDGWMDVCVHACLLGRSVVVIILLYIYYIEGSSSTSYGT